MMDINSEQKTNKQTNTSKAVLLLHGLGVYGQSWGYQRQALTDLGYQVITPDLPGFGHTPPMEGRWTVEKAAQFALGEMDRAGHENFVVAGLSMGGVVALEIALCHTQRIRGLVLINTFSALRPGSLSEVVYFLKRGLRAYIASPAKQAELVAQRIFPNPIHAEWREMLVQTIRESDPNVYRQAMVALARFNANDKLSKINIPTMVITGDEDSTIPPKVQGRMAKKIPGSVQYLVHGANHGVIVDHYQEVNQLLIDFLERIYPS